MSVPEAAYELVPVEDLTEHPDNPRKGDVEGIVTSIVRNGWHGVLTVQRSTGLVIIGNHRLRAARQLGMTHVPVEWKDCTDEQARNDLVADNRAGDLGHFDEDALAEMLVEADPDALSSMLFSAEDVAGLVLPLEPPDDDVAEPAADPDGVVITTTAAEGTDGYLAAQTRSIVLPYALADYIVVADGLRDLRRAYGLDTNAAVVARLVAEVAAKVRAEG